MQSVEALGNKGISAAVGEMVLDCVEPVYNSADHSNPRLALWNE